MKDEAKTKRQLIQELLELRQQIVEFEKGKAERKQVEEALKDSEKRYRQVVESATEMIHTTDLRGYFTFANSAALKVVGYTLEEIKRLNYLGSYPSRTPPAAVRNLCQSVPRKKADNLCGISIYLQVWRDNMVGAKFIINV